MEVTERSEGRAPRVEWLPAPRRRSLDDHRRIREFRRQFDGAFRDNASASLPAARECRPEVLYRG